MFGGFLLISLILHDLCQKLLSQEMMTLRGGWVHHLPRFRNIAGVVGFSGFFLVFGVLLCAVFVPCLAVFLFGMLIRFGRGVSISVLSGR